jgi:hypothetical protein
LISDRGEAGRIRIAATPEGCAWRASSDSSWLQVFPLTGTGSRELSYTIYPNLTVRPRNARVNVNGSTLTFTQVQGGQDENQRFVALMYFAAFGRYPSAGDLAFHMGTMPDRANKAADFFFSAEFDLTGRFIAGAYRGLLRRLPEYSGWLFQRNAIATGVITQQSLVANMLESAEFKLHHPSLTNEQFVRMLYAQILEREPSPADMQFHLSTLREGTLAQRAQKATEFLAGAEFTRRVGSDLTTMLLYALFLQRDATPEEFAHTRARMTDQASVRQVIREFIASSEFRGLLI